RPSAAVLIYPSTQPAFTGTYPLHLVVESNSTKPVPIRKIAELLKKNRKRLQAGELVCQLDANYAALLPALSKLGIHIQSLITIGEPKRALKKLRAHYGRGALEEAFSRNGLEVIPMRASQLNSVMEVIRSEFQRNPQFGWFVGTPSYLAQAKKEI